jgi:hypothetical protein
VKVLVFVITAIALLLVSWELRKTHWFFSATLVLLMAAAVSFLSARYLY